MSINKHCKRCDRTLPIEDFHNSKNMKDGKAFYCKECMAVYGKKYRATTAGIYSNIKGRTVFASNHDKKSGRGYSYGKTEFNIPKDVFISWYDNEPKTCCYCDISEEDLSTCGDIFNESIIRLTLECKDNDLGYIIDNIALACLRCNSIKGDIFTFDEMREIAQSYIKPKWERGKES